MAQYCGNCGSKLNNGLCPKCGNTYLGIYEPYLLLKCKKNTMNRILIHIIVNCLIWLGIGMVQIYNFHYIIGIWNIVVCLYGIFTSYNIKLNTESFIRKWDKSIVSILIFCIINLLLHSIEGFILNLHMLYIRYIINKNKMLLCSKGGI